MELSSHCAHLSVVLSVPLNHKKSNSSSKRLHLLLLQKIIFYGTTLTCTHELKHCSPHFPLSVFFGCRYKMFWQRSHACYRFTGAKAITRHTWTYWHTQYTNTLFVYEKKDFCVCPEIIQIKRLRIHHSLSINLLIVFASNWSVVYKMSENSKNKMCSGDVLFSLANSPKPKYVHFAKISQRKAANSHIWENANNGC